MVNLVLCSQVLSTGRDRLWCGRRWPSSPLPLTGQMEVSVWAPRGGAWVGGAEKASAGDLKVPKGACPMCISQGSAEEQNW